MKTCVTGGAGFIGSNLVDRLLADGHEVVVLDNLSTGRKENLGEALARVEFLEGDLRDPKAVARAVAGCEVVYHQAALASVARSVENPVEVTEVNVMGTLNVLVAARDAQVRRVVFASSSSVYGINEKVPFCEDDAVDRPISPYATTKRAGELLCFNYHHLYGLRTSCLRFFTVYGPSQRPEMAIAKFTDLLARGQTVPLFGTGQTRRDYTYIDDIVDGVIAALDLAPGFEIFNLGGSQTTTLIDLVHGIAGALGVEARVEMLPEQPGDVPITFADVSKAGRMLGYSPKVPIREGLRRVAAWYRGRHAG